MRTFASNHANLSRKTVCSWWCVCLCLVLPLPSHSADVAASFIYTYDIPAKFNADIATLPVETANWVVWYDYEKVISASHSSHREVPSPSLQAPVATDQKDIWVPDFLLWLWWLQSVLFPRKVVLGEDAAAGSSSLLSIRSKSSGSSGCVIKNPQSMIQTVVPQEF